MAEAVYGLSALQEGILYHALQHEDEDRYIVQISCRLPQLDRQRWQQAWRTAIRRHDVLRTAFAWQKVAKPVQVVLADAMPAWETLDWTDVAPAQRDSHLAAFLRQDRQRGLKLTSAPLARMTLAELGEDGALFVWSYHHLILDAWSASLVMAEVLEAYLAPHAPLAAPCPPFRHYIRHRAERDRRQAEAFWAARLAGHVPAPLQLQSSGPAREAQMRSAEWQGDAGQAHAMRAFLRAERRTLAHLVQAAWALLLHRYTDADDIVFGWVISDRPAALADVEHMVGLMVDTVPMRLQLDGARTARQLLADIAAASVDLAEHAHLPLTEIQRLAGLDAGDALFDTIVVIENLPTRPPGSGAELRVLERRAHWRTSYALSLMAAFEDRLKLQIAYNQRQYAPATVERLLGQLSRLLRLIVDQPAATLAQIVAAAAMDEALSMVHGPALPPQATAPASAPLMAALRARPHAESVLAADAGPAWLSAGELAHAAATVARALTALDIGPGHTVAVEFERGPELLAAMLGVMESGAAFLPLVPGLPAQRRDFMLADSQATLWLGAGDGGDGSEAARPPLALEGIAQAVHWRALPGKPARAAGTAYILYTSGSSGQPKGVAIGHASLDNLLRSMALRPGLDDSDTLLATTPVSFDIALLELLLPLATGARLVLAPAGLLRDPERTAELLRQHRITVLQATPTTFAMLADSGWDGQPGLRLWSGGEALHRELADRLLARGAQLWNLYGPTETTIWSMCAAVAADGQPIDLGSPIHGTELHLLDRLGRPAVPGVAAEIVIGGAGVGLGYIGAVASDAFDTCAPGQGGRCYRTGDLGRLGDDGKLYYVGRNDGQVKLRGVRLELAAVEAVLEQHPAVARAAARLWRMNGTTELVAYVVLREETDDAQLLAHAAQRLTDAELPRHFIHLPVLPTTFNGKTDRARLPAPDDSKAALQAAVSAASVVEQLVMQIWSGALGVPLGGVHDNFFALGGHSLKVIAAMGGINRAFGVALPLATLFQHPSPRAFAGALQRAIAGVQPRPVPARTARGTAQPLSSSQRRLWYLNKLDPHGRSYVLASGVRMDGALDRQRLSAAFDALQRQHGVLRTVFREQDGVARQTVLEQPTLALQILHAEGAPPAAWQEMLNTLALQPLPLDQGVPARAVLLCIDARQHVLLLTIHHMLVDEWALALLLRDLGRCYAPGVVGPAADDGLDYIDYAAAEWQQSSDGGHADAIGYWRGKLAGVPVTTLPSQRARPEVLVFEGANLTVTLEPALWAGVQRLARLHAVTPFVVVLTGFFALMQRYLASNDLCLGTMDAGRDEPGLEPVVGPFAKPIALRVEFADELSFVAQLARAQSTLIEAWLHRDAPFDQIVNSVRPAYRANLNPLFQIMLVMQNLKGADAAFDDIGLTPVAVDTAVAEFDLMLEMFEAGDGLTLRASFNSNLYQAGEIALFLRRYERLLWCAVDDPQQTTGNMDFMSDETGNDQEGGTLWL